MISGLSEKITSFVVVVVRKYLYFCLSNFYAETNFQIRLKNTQIMFMKLEFLTKFAAFIKKASYFKIQ